MAVQEWKLDGLLEELATINGSMKDRSFAFVLGAGASFTSGIPTGEHLAQRWLSDLHKRECLDDLDHDSWLATGALGVVGLSVARAAEFYSEIFERRFRGDPEAGYAELETAMEGKAPSLGYSLLAEIIQHTRHKVVITTNFDNLVADALAMHAHQSPLVVAHEALAGFVRPQLRRPLVAKIHRDLFLAPKNDPVGVDTMEQGWQHALRKLFQHYTPIVIGYGGNDGSLMGLLKSLNKGEIAGRMIWCYRDGSLPLPAVQSVLEAHDGIQVKIAGFDEFMLQLAIKLIANFDLSEVADRTQRLGQERAERYRLQAEELRQSSSKGSAAQQQAGELLSKSVRSSKSWWGWQMRADAEPDFQQRNAIYLEGLKHFPQSAELHGNYANYLKKGKDYDAAEAMYKKALELEPSNASVTGNYAIFLSDVRQDYDAAEAMHKKALELDPSKARYAGNYAIFLRHRRKDYDAAEAMYKKALELEPSNASVTGNYAIFLSGVREDYDAAEAMHKKSLELDPSNANHTGNYARFLRHRRKDYDAAEGMYKKALELDPSNAIHTGNYANFLADVRKDYDTAEAMYKKALELEPSSAAASGNYALFLWHRRKDHDAAEAMYKKALELEPSSAAITGNYAIFLSDVRKDYDAAEAVYKKALELDPQGFNLYANFAALLLVRGEVDDLEHARMCSERTLSICAGDANQACAEALLYLCLCAELTAGDVQVPMTRLKALLRLGYSRGSWDFTWLFEGVLPRIAQARVDLYRALGDAILDAELVSKLEEFEGWQTLGTDTPGMRVDS